MLVLNKPLSAIILTCLGQFRYILNTTLPIEIQINVSGLVGSPSSYLHSFSLKSPSTQTSSFHQFYSFIMEKSSNQQLLNGKIFISSFPKFSIYTAFNAQIHQIISKFSQISSLQESLPSLFFVSNFNQDSLISHKYAICILDIYDWYRSRSRPIKILSAKIISQTVFQFVIKMCHISL